MPEAWTPDVTVVIPTRGRPELLRTAVASVAAQDYAGSIRCLVVHDQEAPDTALEELSGPRRSVEVLANDGPTGLAASRNAGLRRTSTELVASCDDDDWWMPGKLTRQVDWLRRNPGAMVVGAGIRLVMGPDHLVDWVGPSDIVTRHDLVRSRRKELHSSTLVMRREVFDRVGGYDEKLPQSYAEDYEWLLRASALGPIGVVREPLASIKKDGQSWFRERTEVVAEALEYLLRTHPELEGSRRGHARILGQIAFARASLGERRAALGWIRKAVLRFPVAPQAGLALVQVVGRGDPTRLLKTARRVGRGLA